MASETAPPTMLSTITTEGVIYYGGDFSFIGKSGSNMFQLAFRCSSNNRLTGVYARTNNPSTNEWYEWFKLSFKSSI